MRNAKIVVVCTFITFAFVLLITRQANTLASGKALGPGLLAPSGLSATDNTYANKVGLYWEPVRGATIYRVFRNTVDDPGSAVDVGSTQANYFFDPSTVAAQPYFYWVRAENSQAISSMSLPDQGVRAIQLRSPGPPFPPLEPPPAPPGNQITAAKAYLGKALFWDEQLSSTKTVACATCHRPGAGGSDPRTSAGTRNPGFDNTFDTPDDVFGSPGVFQNGPDGTYSPSQFYGMGLQVTDRKSPTYLNNGYTADSLFWDGRATSTFRDPITNNILLSSFAALESQSVAPPVSSVEMAHVGRDWTNVASRVTASKPLALATNIPAGLAGWIDGRSYPELFQEAFGTPDVTPARIAMAIGTHERSLFTDQTPLDKWAVGTEELTPQEEQGRTLFVNQNCVFCHGGALLSNGTFNNVGVRPTTEDRGRGAITAIPDDNGRFKTPILRNLELRAPYMHNGRFAAVEDVVEFYNRGGDFDAPNIDRARIRPLNLTAQQKAALVAFLKRPLTDPRVRDQLPPFDRPLLYSESNRVPVISGVGRVGSGGAVPNVIAVEPPIAGNQSFSVSVGSGLAGASATLVIDTADPGLGSAIPASGSFAYRQITLQGSGNEGYGSAVLQIPDSPALIGQTFHGRWYIVDPAATNGFSVSRLFTFTVFGNAVARAAKYDFDGDHKSDISIFRPSAGEWWYRKSSDGQTRAGQFGSSSDVITPGDFTGDGKTDLAFFRPAEGRWYVLRSDNDSDFAIQFGQAGDIPMPADFDGDGKTDAAVFRPSEGLWFILRSSDTGVTFAQFGTVGDQPVAADYDGDGKADIAIVRNIAGNIRQWWIQRTTLGIAVLNFGVTGDITVPGDYTGDGKADVAVFHPNSGQTPSEWYILRSEDFSYFSFPWGQNGDVPVPADYDGDGKFEAGVFRPSDQTWYINQTTGGPLFLQFGLGTDKPIPSLYNR